MTSNLIDSEHLGLDRVIGSWERDGALVDPGPSSSIETVLQKLGSPPAALFLTHIHLDHAGASGTLVQRFPELKVYVHERGAPHLIDPAKLLESAGRLYGDDMERLWGEVVPVPEENVVTLSGGESIDGLEVIYTPGHASHHVSYLDTTSGDAFVGDVGGVRIPPSGVVRMPTPPPDIDIELWDESLRRLEELAPRRLLLTHFGAVDDPAAHIASARAELARASAAAEAGDREAFLGDLASAVDAEPGDVAERFRSAMPLDQVWLGLERYWRKRRERGAGAS
jgi:glyoxylase-like metal-dependent hydrolase (beta-lactamase superfamily II)